MFVKIRARAAPIVQLVALIVQNIRFANEGKDAEFIKTDIQDLFQLDNLTALDGSFNKFS